LADKARYKKEKLEVANAMKEEMKRLKKEEKNKGMFMNIC
jgi:hypothetical protein